MSERGSDGEDLGRSTDGPNRSRLRKDPGADPADTAQAGAPGTVPASGGGAGGRGAGGRGAGGRGRRLALIAVLLGLAALIFWVASRVTWAELVAADGLTPARTFTVKGADWAAALTPLAIVFLAAIAAAVSLRGWALRITAVLVALVAVAGTIPALTMLTGGDDTDYAAKAIDLEPKYDALQVETTSWPALLVMVGAALAVVAAFVMLQTASRDAPMSSKYKSPAARRADLEKEVFAKRDAERRIDGGSPDEAGAVAGGDTGSKPGDNNERLLWDALDTGDDPTIDPTDREK